METKFFQSLRGDQSLTHYVRVSVFGCHSYDDYIFFKLWLETNLMIIHDPTVYFMHPLSWRGGYPKIWLITQLLFGNAKQLVRSLKGVSEQTFINPPPITAQDHYTIQDWIYYDDFLLQKDCRWCSAVNLQWNSNL